MRIAPKSLIEIRNILAAVAAVAAMEFMISAAVDFNPANRQKLLDIGVIKMLLGAVLIGIAIWFSTRVPALAKPISHPLSKPHRFWWLIAGVGALIMLILSESNGRFLQIEALGRIHLNVQYAMLIGSSLLILYGLGGLPRITLSALRVSREERLTVIAVIAILLLALFLRLWQQEDTIRTLIDELHWSDGLMRLIADPYERLLYPMSGQSPYSNVFPYWQAAAVEVIGYTWTGFRFVSAICGTLTVLATYGLGRAIFDRKTALLGMLAIATFPPAIHFSRVAMALIGDPLFGTMAVMFIARALHRNHRIEWAAAGISLGFTQYFYEGGRLLFPALVIGWLIVLAVSGHLRGRWRGVLILFVAFILVGGPIYYTIIGNDLPLFGRMEASGDRRLTEELEDGIQIEEIVERIEHALTAFTIYAAHDDLSVYYGGNQPLVNVVIVPMFLFGAFYLLWRFPAPAFLIPLWILAVGAGNGLLRDTLVSARYYVVLPPLALASMAGVRYFLPFLAGLVSPTQDQSDESEDDYPPEFPDAAAFPARPSMVWQLAGGLTTVACVVIAMYHVAYYYGPHLEIFNIQLRESKPYRDGIDVAERSIDLPGNTQVIISGAPENDQNVPRNWLRFISREGNPDPTRYFPLRSYPTATISPRYLLDLTPGLNYAFFVEPTDEETMRLLYRYFPQASPPQYSSTNLAANKEYVLIWVPAVVRLLS